MNEKVPLESRHPMKSSQPIWKCTDNCGACCRLDPEERGEALSVLNEDQLEEYLGMVGEDGWCRNLDKLTKRCLIYENRPDFCRVKSMKTLFKVSNEKANEFAIKCCKSHIKSIYGGRSTVMKRFLQNLKIK